jgi:hypothetical protein
MSGPVALGLISDVVFSAGFREEAMRFAILSSNRLGLGGWREFFGSFFQERTACFLFGLVSGAEGWRGWIAALRSQ